MEYTGKILIDLIPKIYDTERVVRVLGIDEKTEFVEINKQVWNPKTGAYEPVNDLSTGKYDVTVSVGPSYKTKRLEAADSLMQFVQAVPNAGVLIMDLIAKNMDWPGAEQVARRLETLLPPEVRQLEMEDAELPPEVMAQVNMIVQQAEQIVGQRDQQIQALSEELQKAMEEAQSATQKAAEARLKLLSEQSDRTIEMEKIASNERQTAAKINADLQKTLVTIEAKIDEAQIEASNEGDAVNMVTLEAIRKTIDEIKTQPTEMYFNIDASSGKVKKELKIQRDAEGKLIGATVEEEPEETE